MPYSQTLRLTFLRGKNVLLLGLGLLQLGLVERGYLFELGLVGHVCDLSLQERRAKTHVLIDK